MINNAIAAKALRASGEEARKHSRAIHRDLESIYIDMSPQANAAALVLAGYTSSLIAAADAIENKS